jgi:hypothetical protein
MVLSRPPTRQIDQTDFDDPDSNVSPVIALSDRSWPSKQVMRTVV